MAADSGDNQFRFTSHIWVWVLIGVMGVIFLIGVAMVLMQHPLCSCLCQCLVPSKKPKRTPLEQAQRDARRYEEVFKLRQEQAEVNLLVPGCMQAAPQQACIERMQVCAMQVPPALQAPHLQYGMQPEARQVYMYQNGAAHAGRDNHVGMCVLPALGQSAFVRPDMPPLQLEGSYNDDFRARE